MDNFVLRNGEIVPGLISTDGVHLTQAGTEKLIDNINRVIKIRSASVNLSNCICNLRPSTNDSKSCTNGNKYQSEVSIIKNDQNASDQENINTRNYNMYGHSEKGIKLTCHNVQHILPKIDEIRSNFESLGKTQRPDIIGMCETFLNTKKCKRDSNEINIPGYSNERKDRENSKGGGWIVYFDNDIKYERMTLLESENIETVWFKIFPKHKESFLLCFVYRPPNSQTSWYTNFENEVVNGLSINDNILLMGDFNIDCWKPLPSKWLSFIKTYGLHQMGHTVKHGLANINMPCGRGKKPHIATQKRKGEAIKINEKALTYLDDHDQPKFPAPSPPDGGYIIYFLKDCDNKVSRCYG
ncbi:unnamed protein product [Mytilus coruscus]|uniref:Endonuclease/exonuclease/phosphatase domain-containing protein n=1 Tax=Mytilus coruscus TaxID=42192 RepID=A0A6J8CFA4_MYTCO|nr:unnamed protein product [Mytilus coruscus]